MTVLLTLMYIFVLFPLGVVWSGYALSSLWAWFLVPALGVPALSIPAAIGLGMVVTYMTYQPKKEDLDKQWIDKLIDGALWLGLRPALALGFGWLVARWM